jgi:hypothetical protein
MPGLSGLALTTEQIIEVISMYASSDAGILAVAAAPGWKVIGTFPMPTNANVTLDLTGCVSDPSLTLSARLYCVSPGFIGAIVGSIAQLQGNTIDDRVFSSTCALAGGRLYQIHAQVVGAEGDAFFGSVRRACPVGVT